MVSSQSGQTLYKWNYTVQTSLRGINAISDYVTINNDAGWQAGPNDDQYLNLGGFFGYTEGKVDSTSILLELNLMFQTSNGLPTITFQALQNGTSLNTFTLPITVGHTYNRQIIVTPPIGVGSLGGDSPDNQALVTWLITDITATSSFTTTSFDTLSFVLGRQSFTASITPNSRFNGMAYDGITWWTFAPAPTSNPLEYDVAIKNYGYSLDYGNTYNQFTGSEIVVLTDGRYRANTLIYPVFRFHMVSPGQTPKIGMART